MPGGFADLAEYFVSKGVSPEKDLQGLETYLNRNLRSNYLRQAELRLIEGRITLIRAEWLCKTQPSSLPPKETTWRSLAQQAKDKIEEAVRQNRWLTRAATPYLQRAHVLLTQTN